MIRDTTRQDTHDGELSEGTHILLNQISDGVLRAKVARVCSRAVAALDALAKLHLPQDVFEQSDDSKESRPTGYPELAPYVLAALQAINELLTELATAFPAPTQAATSLDDEEFDLEFDLVDETAAARASTAATVETPVDPTALAADASFAYGGMLRSRVERFGERLRHALGQGSDWPLLAELDDSQHQLRKAVQGVMFGLLTAVAGDYRREDILPEYRSTLTESLALRTALATLTFHFTRFNEALGAATPEAAVPLVVAMSDRLARFAAKPEYRMLRAEDKKSVIDFRAALYRHRRESGQQSLAKIRLDVEGFSKFLESLRAINHREVLILHDQRLLADTQRALEAVSIEAQSDAAAAALRLDQIVRQLQPLHGRNPELDSARIEYESATHRPPLDLLVAMWQSLIAQTIAMAR